MSNIDEVRSAEKRMQHLMERMKLDPMGKSRYVDKLTSASDEYARAIRELEIPPRTSK